jgi:DNA-binding transcriptional regulator PaaX
VISLIFWIVFLTPVGIEALDPEPLMFARRTRKRKKGWVVVVVVMMIETEQRERKRERLTKKHLKFGSYKLAQGLCVFV